MTYYICTILIFLFIAGCNDERKEYNSPGRMAFSPDTKMLAVCDETGNLVYLINPENGEIKDEWPIDDHPSGVLWIDQNEIFVSGFETGDIITINTETGEQKLQEIKIPMISDMVYLGKRDEILAISSGLNKIYFLNNTFNKILDEMNSGHHPTDIAVTPDGKLALIANLLPPGPANEPTAAATIDVIDLSTHQKIKDIPMLYGSTNLKDICISSDGKWVYAVHTRGRVSIPTSQLERGWVNTNVMSIIDMEKLELYTTVMLDMVSEGAADPTGIALSPDNSKAWVTIAGTHELAEIDLDKLHAYLAGKSFPEGISPNDAKAKTAWDIWMTIKEDPGKRHILADQLSALYAARVLKREKLSLFSPRKIAMIPGKDELIVAEYYKGSLKVIRTDDLSVSRAISLGPQRDPDEIRAGEIIFHDATNSFQHWLSCASCHPHGRADGLNWDLLNDGIGNPKNTKSLTWTHLTPPVMSLGVRPSYETAVQKGFHFIQFYQANDEEQELVKAYLRSLQPPQSPYTSKSPEMLSADLVSQGKLLFESEATGCASCHPAPLYTNLKKYDVGTMMKNDRKQEFDTPTLIELWRTGPYLHNGAASTVKEILTIYNKEDKHGKTSHLGNKEIDALEAFLLSL